MKRLLTVCCIASAAALMAQAQAPAIKAGGVVNSASYANPGLPNGAIAEGSLFIVFGSNMGPGVLQQITSYPLNTALAGTSLSVTVNGTTTKPLLVYTSANQLAAILPSATPVGTGTVTVTYNAQTSAPQPITVASSSFGIYSVNQAGSGPGIITNANYQVAGQTASANPGEAFIVWGTGLGPVTGDESAGGSAVKIGSIPVEVLVGGKSASVIAYARASCCAGLDQVAFYIPAGVTGCSVPVAVKIGNVVSNYVSVAVAASGRACSDAAGPPPITVSGNGTVSFGEVDISRSTSSLNIPGVSAPPSVTDSGSGAFTREQYPAYTSYVNPYQIATYGSCTVFTFAGSTATPGNPPVPIILDAGPQLTVTGPGGTKVLTKATTPGSYSATLGGGFSFPGAPPPAPLYLAKGAYTVTGPGGADVGPFTATLNVPDPQVWTNAAAVNTINRAAGQLITWSGGDPSGTTTILGISIAGTTANSFGAAFICIEKTSAGQFTVPSSVLLSLPTSGNAGVGGLLSVGSAVSVPFKATGLDQANFSSSTTTQQTVTFQ